MGGQEQERRAWITLASVEGAGEETLAMLIGQFGSAQEILRRAGDGRLALWSQTTVNANGRHPLTRPVLAGIEAAARDPEALLRVIADLGLWTVTPLDHGYPARLRDLDPPPAVIHGLGDPEALLQRRSVAVVGTRRPTPAGRLLTTRICSRLVECGAAVISGLAIGIDGAAHAATVERGGMTVGVIGAGHRRPGPRAHAALRDRIAAQSGSVISEHHPRVRASKGTYPRRNRIIAALGDAVIVVEAPLRSGALITARHALELGRPVLVAPGRVGDWSVAGSLALLRDSPARPLVGLDELVADLGYFEPTDDDGPATGRADGARGPALAMLGPAERQVAVRLCSGPAGLDLLVAETGLPPSVVSSAVTLLLLRGWAQPMGPAYLPSGPLAE
jgi:DNA processing protein